MTETDSFLVPVARIMEFWNPMAAWPCDAITIEEVRAAVAAGRSEPTPHDVLLRGEHLGEENLRAYHISRIAHLIQFPDDEPICINVGCPSLGAPVANGALDVSDGNHRLAAAFVKGDLRILATYEGESELFEEFFPGTATIS